MYYSDRYFKVLACGARHIETVINVFNLLEVYDQFGFNMEGARVFYYFKGVQKAVIYQQ